VLRGKMLVLLFAWTPAGISRRTVGGIELAENLCEAVMVVSDVNTVTGVSGASEPMLLEFRSGRLNSSLIG
jgi:hypothetical protein